MKKEIKKEVNEKSMNRKLKIYKLIFKFEKIKNSFLLFWYKVQKFMTPNRQLFAWYLIITLFGATLLYLPITHNDPTLNFDYLDALFTSASAFSDTGLTVSPTAQSFNIFGQIIIFILFIIGGIGWFSIKMLFFSYLLRRGRKGVYKTQKELSEEKGFINQGSAINVIKFATFSILFFIVLFTIILTPFFYLTEASAPTDITYYSNAMSTFNDPEGNLGLSLWTALFTSASAINNAGFDITSSYSLAPYFDNVFLQVSIMFLFIFGGIGFPILYDCKEYFKNRSSGIKFRLSVVTKIAVGIYFAVALVGWLLVVLFEMVIFTSQGIASSNNLNSDISLEPLTIGEQLWAITFNTFSTRNAGFSTVSMNAFSQQSQMVFIVMMFIGSGPSSTAGGIRTTTMGIIIFTIWSYMKNRNDTIALKKTIPKSSVYEAFIVSATAIILTFVSVMVVSSSLSSTELRADGQPYSMIDVIFEVMSAFGTTGLSNGLTSQANDASLIILLLVMFIGQLGVPTLLKQFRAFSGGMTSNSSQYTSSNVFTG